MIIKNTLAAGVVTALGLSLALGIDQSPDHADQPLQQEQQQEQMLEHEQQDQEYGLREHQQDLSNKLSELQDIEIHGQDGQQIGQFEDVVVDLESGEISFIIVAGEDQQRRPIPVDSIEINGTREDPELTVKLTEQDWQNAPTIGRDEVSELGEEQRAQEVRQFYEQHAMDEQDDLQFGAPRIRQHDEDQQDQPGLIQDQENLEEQDQQSEFGRPGQRHDDQVHLEGLEEQDQQTEYGAREDKDDKTEYGARDKDDKAEYGARDRDDRESAKLGRDLMEASVLGQDDEEIGQISDLILNIPEGKVSFVLIEGADREEQYAVAPQALESAEENQFSLDVTRQDLEQAESLAWQDLQEQAQQQEFAGADQARESPQVFRFEDDDDTAVFGIPDREETDRDQEEEEQREMQDTQERQPQTLPVPQQDDSL